MKVRINHPDIVHDVGDVVDVSDERGQRLVDIGYADPAERAATPPSQSATKSEWIEWAVSQGADAPDAEAMTKAELIERFG